MENKLKDKVIIITGAASGIGKETAFLLASQGAKVVVCDINEDGVKSVAKEIQEKKGVALPLKLNVALLTDINNVIKETLENFGTIDVCVNNAGILDNFKPLAEVDDELWDKVIAVNLTGAMKMARACMPTFLKNQKGNIINISSIGGVTGCRGGLTYVTSKHALIGLTKNTAAMYGSMGIRCNAVAPGSVATNINSSNTQISKFGLDKIMAGIGTSIKNGTSNEVANIISFLSSEESSLINGAVLVADAGWTAY